MGLPCQQSDFSVAPAPGAWARPMRLRLFRNNQALIAPRVADPSGQIDSYERRYRRSLHGVEPLPASLGEFLDNAAAHPVTVIGDFHTLPRTTASAAAIAEALWRRGTPLVLALEIFSPRHDADIRAYLDGRKDLPALRAASRFDRTWGEALWDHYAQLLRWARERRVPVCGIDQPGGSLPGRDEAAAIAIGSQLRRQPGRRVFVLMGELHTAPGHLPRNLRKWTGREPLVLHQSPEPLLWRLDRAGEAGEWYKLGDSRFVRPAAHPLVPQSTFAYHILGAEHADRCENWERAFRYAAKRVGEMAHIDVRPMLDDLHIQPDTGKAFRVHPYGNESQAVECSETAELDDLAALAARVIVRFSGGRKLRPVKPAGDPALLVREDAAACLAGLWINPWRFGLATAGAPSRARVLALSIDRAMAFGTSRQILLRNLFLGSGYARETETALLRRLEETAAA